MRRLKGTWGWVSTLISLFLLQSASVSVAAAPPVVAFATPPRISDVNLSFDGKSVAWLDNGSTPAQIIVLDLATHKDRYAWNIPTNQKVRDIKWADNDTLIYTISTTWQAPRDSRVKFEMFRSFIANAVSGKTSMMLSDLVDFEWVTAAKILATHTSRPHTVLLSALHATSHNMFGRWDSAVYAVDTVTNRSQLIEEGPASTDSWVVDPDGNPVARTEWPEPHRFVIAAKRGAGWTQIYRRDDNQGMLIEGLTLDRKSILAVGTDQDGRSKLMTIPIDGSAPSAMVQDPERNVVSVLKNPADGAIEGVGFDGMSTRLQYMDPVLEHRFNALHGIFAGQHLWIRGHSPDFNLMAIEVSSPTKPPAYYLIDYLTMKANLLGEAYPGLASVKLGEVKSITYKARDGQDIPAILTLPPGATGTNPLPMVMLPHGGPEARDYLEFDYTAQLLASRGYLVLQPQFRGSIGFGEEFRKAGEHQWGGLMQDDVTDGVDAMIAQHLADPSRICIMGASYGGYAALAGAAFTPNKYKCAISINGVFDLPLIQVYEEKEWGSRSSVVRFWHDHMGSRLDPHLADVSPNRHPGGISANVLLLHSTDDTVVPFDQSESMAKALSLNGRKTSVVKLPGDDHWLSYPETRIKALTEVDNFLRTNLSTP